MARALFLSASVAALLLSAPPAAAMETLVEQLPMDDGVKLHTVVSLPDATDSFPVALVRSPYQDDFTDQLGLVTLLGYAVVVQDTRGTGQSEGEIDVFFSDRADGQATLDWVLQQPWCSGEVSMWGGSALAIPEYLLAPGAPAAMICQSLAIATPDVYAHGVFHGGVFKQKDVQSWTGWIGASPKLDELEDRRLCDSWWDPVRANLTGGAIHTAGVHVGGWADVFTQGTLDGYAMYRQTDDLWAAENQYLIMGPWEHNKLGEPKVGELTLPAEAGLDLVELAIGWLDHCHGDWPVDWAPVQYWVMGAVDEPGAPGNVWREAETWPPAAEEVALHVAGADALGWNAPAEAVALALPFDPADPSPTVGGRNLTLKAGPRDQATVEARPDAAVLTTAPLEEPLEVTGHLFASMVVATNAADSDLAVRVTDVYPDGRSMLVTEGIQRLSMRDGCEAQVEVVPGEAVRIEVDLWSTSWIFAAGHRLRVVLTTTNHPRYELNADAVATDPATGEPVPVVVTVTSTPEEPSFLRLPVPLPPVEPPDEGPEEEPEVGPEVVAEETPEVGPEPMPEIGPEPMPEVGPEPIVEEAPEPMPEGGPEPMPEIGPEPMPEVGPEPVPEPAPEAAPDAGPDVSDLAAPDVSADAGAKGEASSGCAGSGGPGGAPATGLAWLLLALAAARRGATAGCRSASRR